MPIPALAAAAIPAAISALGTIGGGYISRSGKPKESKIQKQKRYTIDDILRSIKGDGPYSDLFSFDEDAFQRSFVDPAKSRFKNQIAPQIQQSYIASGQQRGTGLEDTLSRAGVDLDQLLNEKYMEFMQQAQNRKLNSLNAILGGSEGVAPGDTMGESLRQATGGYLTSDAFSSSIEDMMSAYNQQYPKQQPVRKGFQA